MIVQITIGKQYSKSFTLVIYDAALQELARYQFPMAVAAPIANRIAKEILHIADGNSHLPEPWYSVDACSGVELKRSPLPEGPTSLYSKRYTPETNPSLSMHPEASTRFFEIALYDLQRELYRGIYTMDDVFLHGANYLLRHKILKSDQPHPDKEASYFYQVIPSSRTMQAISSDLLPEDAYKIEGLFRLPPPVKEAPRIQFRPIPPPPLPEKDLTSFEVIESHGKGETQNGQIFIPARLYDDLCRRIVLSERKEEGGYILGNIYRLPGSPENEDAPDFRWAVEVTDLIMAEDTVGSAAVLLFTGDSWSKISRRRDRDYPTRRLIGWFHTHLFPASDAFGLSGLDQDMHSWYLPKPWQIAILLNLEENNKRIVRCYQRATTGELVETHFKIVKEPLATPSENVNLD